ncbi:hypothetical protein ACE1CI_03265 [Aerosakkonemataceae cyanobacterium BLCC-F50]|uniref:Uncharacterized protein n=1 Tax=Floridaenema flaviceps BLCC-F50 TaxID=3153642 RepID=A0ABV4XJR3_9CYAN
MTTTSRITPFSNGTEYHIWLESNCYKCCKYAADSISVEDGACEIELALSDACMDDGTIDNSIYSRMGERTGKCCEFQQVN